MLHEMGGQKWADIIIPKYSAITVSAAYAVIGVDRHLLIFVPTRDAEAKPGPRDCDVVLLNTNFGMPP